MEEQTTYAAAEVTKPAANSTRQPLPEEFPGGSVPRGDDGNDCCGSRSSGGAETPGRREPIPLCVHAANRLTERDRAPAQSAAGNGEDVREPEAERTVRSSGGFGGQTSPPYGGGAA